MPELEPARKPDRYCLLVDQGNSRLKWISAIWTNRSQNWGLDVTTFGEGAVEDFAAVLDAGDIHPPEEILICSVSSDENQASLRNLLAGRSSAQLTRVRSQARTCGISNGYRDPEQLGDDRWMAIVGAACHHGAPLVVMDLGTASTLDAVDQDGRHLGGLIIPGPGTMMDSLGLETSLEINRPEFPGRLDCALGEPQAETQAAIRWGIATAQTSTLHEFITRTKAGLNDASEKNLRVLITGGAADVIIKQSDHRLIHDPLLVFKGMLRSRFGHGESES